MADTTHRDASLSEDGFHEIQLSGKQLVFLFMSGATLAVLIFLCGVQVGRNAKGDRIALADASAAAATAAPPPASTPTVAAASSGPPAAESPAPPQDDELSYAKRLQAADPAAGDKVAAPAPAAAAAETKPVETRPAPAKPAAAAFPSSRSRRTPCGVIASDASPPAWTTTCRSPSTSICSSRRWKDLVGSPVPSHQVQSHPLQSPTKP